MIKFRKPLRILLPLPWVMFVACGDDPKFSSDGASGAAGTMAGALSGTGAGGTVGTAGAGGALPTGGGGSDSSLAGGPGTSGASLGGSAGAGGHLMGGAAGDLPAQAAILTALRLGNDYFMENVPDPGVDVPTNPPRPSNAWMRAVYYEGLIALNGIDPQTRYIDYAVSWGKSHAWGLNGGASTRHADNHCAGQTYLDLYALQNRPEQLHDIKASIDAMVAGAQVSDWTWVDAIQMAMPVFAKLGAITGDPAYTTKMYDFYRHTKTVQGGSGLYNPTDRLWWRDQDFDAPYAEPNGQPCYWSRGNGWVYAALARVLDILPVSDPHRAEYIADFVDMSAALRTLQRPDGFWNVSLVDPTHFGGPELTGTSLFVYGMSWGIRNGLLPDHDYRRVVELGWAAMATAVHGDGSLGWVQSTGKQPSAGQPLAFDKPADLEDFGLGCFLLGGTEVWKLAMP